MRPEPRPGIREMAAHMRGLSKVVGHERVIKLSSNENPFGPCPLAVAAALVELDTMHIYPEAGQTALREAIGQRFGLDPAKIFCGAGSDQILGMLVQAYTEPGDEVVFSANGFAKFKLYAMSVGAVPIAVPDHDFVADVDAILGSVNERTRLIAIANPDNPTSTCISGAELRRLHAGLPDHVLLVIDAATMSAYPTMTRVAGWLNRPKTSLCRGRSRRFSHWQPCALAGFTRPNM